MVKGIGKVAVFLLVVVMMVMEGSKAMILCNMDEKGLMACKPSVTQPDPVDPSTECCEALTGADLTCLCSYKNSMVLPSFGIDPDLAMALPAKCSLAPPSTC